MGTVFISYSHKDEKWKNRLVTHLNALGMADLIAVWEDRQIQGGDNWKAEIEKAIRTADVAVLMISANFLSSDFIQKEEVPPLLMRREKEGIRIIPLIVKPCAWTRVSWLKNLQARPENGNPLSSGDENQIDQALSDFAKEIDDLLRKVPSPKTRPQTNSHPSNRDTLPPVSLLPPNNNFTYRTLGDNFAGRIDALWDLHDLLGKSRAAVVGGVGVVAGTGGLGKTQLAIEYAYRFGASYPGGIFWVDAERGRSEILVQVPQHAGIDIDNKLGEEDQLKFLWRAFEKEGASALIILDNFPEQGNLSPWLPPPGPVHTLVTTRRRDLFNYSPLPLNFMTSEEGVTLLNTGRRKFDSEAEKLVEALGGLPLALELSRNFLNLRTEITIDALLAEIGKTGEMAALKVFEKKYEEELPSGHTRQVAATIRMSWELASENARAVLRSMALLAPAPVPIRLLRDILDLPEESILEDPLGEGVSELSQRLSISELDAENDPWIHRLVAGFVRTTPIDDDLKKRVTLAVRKEMARTQDDKDLRSYRELEKIVPHGDMLIKSEDMESDDAIAGLGRNIGHITLA